MKAIVYTSQTGHTQRYAQMLAERTGVPAYSLKEAGKSLRRGEEIFYMGWLMAGTVKGLQSAMDRYTIRGAAIVGVSPQVPRLSGTPDTLPVLVPEALLTAVRLEDPLRVRGQLRSFNNRSGVGNRLVLTVYAQAMEPGSGEPCNRILLSGALCKPPIFRRTPLGRSICDLMLAVSRRYGRADYLPVIAWAVPSSRTLR